MRDNPLIKMNVVSKEEEQEDEEESPRGTFWAIWLPILITIGAAAIWFFFFVILG